MKLSVGAIRLPWAAASGRTFEERLRSMRDLKVGLNAYPMERRYPGFPGEYSEILQYAKSLAFNTRPDYDYIRAILYRLEVRLPLRLDCPFDWEPQPQGCPGTQWAGV